MCCSRGQVYDDGPPVWNNLSECVELAKLEPVVGTAYAMHAVESSMTSRPSTCAFVSVVSKAHACGVDVWYGARHGCAI